MPHGVAWKRLASVVFCTMGESAFSSDPNQEVTCPTRRGKMKLSYHPSVWKTQDQTTKVTGRKSSEEDSIVAV